MEIINLDMVPGKKSPVCHASQYDDGRVIRFNLYDSGLPYTLDGTESITFEVRKPDGNIVISTLTNTSDSYVDVVTTEQMTAVKGANLCEVRVEKGGTNIGSLNVIMAVEMDPTDGGIASASAIDNLRSQISGMVAEEVAEQYDAGNVIFDSAPTPGHGNGYAVTSEGVNNALASKADRSELPDMSNYYNKTETDTLLDDKADVSDLPDMSNYYTKTETDTALDDKVNTTDFDATNLPIVSGSATNTKDYIDSGLRGKADTSTTYTKTEVDNIVAGRKCATYSIITLDTLTSTEQTFNTYGGRKFSDYDLYIFAFGSSDKNFRRTVVLTKSQWQSGANIDEGVLHGANTSTASSYDYCGIVVNYNTDTSIKAKVFGSGSINKFSVIGIKY